MLSASTPFATTFTGQFLIPLLVLIAFAILTGGLKLYSQVKTLLASSEQVKKEVQPNGGSSLRDAMNRIEAEQRLQGEKQQLQGEKLDQHLKDARRDKKKLDRLVAASRTTDAVSPT